MQTSTSHEFETGLEHNERAEKLIEALRRFDNLFFITIGPDGALGLRPMQVLRSNESGVLWFIADRDTLKVKDALQQGQVYLAAQGEDGLFVAARGRPELKDDDEARRRLWSDELRAWFPDGKDDPRLCFIRVTVEEGEYWDTMGSPASSAVFANIFGPYARGETPEVEAPERHGKMAISP